MRTNIALWWILTGFFVIMSGVYTVWIYLEHQANPRAQVFEPVGSIGLLLVAAMAGMIAFYLAKVSKKSGTLPEDVETALIDDGDPDMGEFSPWSWWPLVLAASAALAVIGLSVGWWLVPIALVVFLVGIVGWVYEYYRGNFAR